MSVLKVCGAIVSLCMLAACAAPQSGGTGTATNVSAAQPLGAASALDINVANTIVRVEGVDDEGLLRAELEDLKAGLYWTRGTRQTDAVIDITGEGDIKGISDGSIRISEFGQTVLFGAISLVDSATGDVVVPPILISVAINENRDAQNIGLTQGTKRSVALEYLVQKFIFEGREALYGPGR